MTAHATKFGSSAAQSGGVLPPGPLDGFRVHMVGIGGSGMSGLAQLLVRRGARVTGTDATDSPTVAQLTAAGARVSLRQAAESVPADAQLLVASAAIKPDHPELTAARDLRVPTLKYAQFLGEVMARHAGIAISGTHGKSTTTAWLAYVLRHAGLDPSFVVGAVSPQLGGGSGVGDGPHFIAEACEYDRSFLSLRPRSAAILNIDEDHLDCYADLAAIRDAFAAFAGLLPADGLLVMNGDDAAAPDIAAATPARVETFGLGERNDWAARRLDVNGGCYSFELVRQGQPVDRLHLGIAGRHNVSNALAVVALAYEAGVPLDRLQQGLREYRGVGRRLELRADVRGLRVIDDYAHHPAEIRATLAAARERFQPTRLWCVFQPHQHSRTRFLMEDFAQSFALADHIIVPDIYFVRDSARDRDEVRAEDLVRRIVRFGGNALHIPEFDAISDYLVLHAQPGDVILTMGAGTIWKVADDLVRRLGGDLPG